MEGDFCLDLKKKKKSFAINLSVQKPSIESLLKEKNWAVQSWCPSIFFPIL